MNLKMIDLMDYCDIHDNCICNITKYSGVARVFQQGGGGGIAEGKEGREIFETLCIKMAYFAH